MLDGEKYNIVKNYWPKVKKKEEIIKSNKETGKSRLITVTKK